MTSRQILRTTFIVLDEQDVQEEKEDRSRSSWNLMNLRKVWRRSSFIFLRIMVSLFLPSFRKLLTTMAMKDHGTLELWENVDLQEDTPMTDNLLLVESGTLLTENDLPLEETAGPDLRLDLEDFKNETHFAGFALSRFFSSSCKRRISSMSSFCTDWYVSDISVFSLSQAT